MSHVRTASFRRPAVLALALALVLPALAHADGGLPSPRSLVDKHIAAMGGLDAMKKNNEGTATGAFSMPAANLTAPMTVWVKGGGEKVAMKISLPGMGDMRSGLLNGVAWSMDPFTGPRLLEGAESAQLTEAYNMDAATRSDKMVANMKNEGLTEYGGKACYKVSIEWKVGRKTWDCYAVDTGLMAASGGKQASPMGEVESVAIMLEYKDLAGQKTATKIEQQVMGQKQIISIDAFDPKAPDESVFALPPAIQALVDKKKAAAK